MALYIFPLGMIQFFDDSGAPLAGGKLYSYQAGTTTALATFQDVDGGTAHANPIVMDADGRPPAPIWLQADTRYKFVLDDSTDVELDQWDDVFGLKEGSADASEWLAGATPTFVDTTNFTQQGDTTTVMHVNRRVKLTDSSTLYGYISASAYSAGTNKTTVTVALDSGVLSSSLTAVEYAFLAATNDSVPQNISEGDYGTDTGAADAYAVALGKVISAYAAGQLVKFTPANTNTAASTLDLNGLGVKDIKRGDGAAVRVGDISASGVASVIYDGTNFVLLSQLAPLVLDSQFTEVGNVGAGEDDLMTYTLPADMLDADGKAVRITAWGNGNNADDVTLKFHFGAASVSLHSGSALATWYATIIVVRSGASLQRIGGFGSRGGGIPVGVDFGGAEDTTGAIVIKFTGENTTDVSDDAIKQGGMLTEFLN